MMVVVMLEVRVGTRGLRNSPTGLQPPTVLSVSTSKGLNLDVNRFT